MLPDTTATTNGYDKTLYDSEKSPRSRTILQYHPTGKRVASLERKIALCQRRQDALDIVKNIALETDKLLSDTTTTTHGYEKTVSDKGFAFLVKDRILSDRKIATLENDYAVSHNRSVENEDLSTVVLQSKHKRFVAEGTVAFSAIKVANQEHVGFHQNIIFEQILTNEGGGYHQIHGVFIAPQSGVYVFSSAIMCAPNGEVFSEMVHNGNLVTRIVTVGDGIKVVRRLS
ncbi:hypothetical protein DPMN_065182 [Dreissena polymorpha]|uniref:C1q domain-containing protein n=1 Tax=Dreissena polymorpha TaxID=45954 RepID=A0A9D4HMW0_DREPO|nr:hypothetical protein DPMN_065182 [Dreissena polymorpha]